jgi:hypothetical protein
MTLRKQVDELLQKAVIERDYREITRLAKIAEEIAELEKQQQQVADKLRNFAAALQSENAKDKLIPDLVPEFIRGVPSARERGNRVRTQYIEGLSRDGILLERVATKKYRTAKGLTIGISYARELETRGASWFMGLADEHFDCIILLCETADENEIRAFVLPPDLVKRVWRALSRSRGQVKLHVTQTGAAYELQLPGHHRVTINQYLNALQILKET